VVIKRVRQKRRQHRHEAPRGRPRVHSEGWSKVSVILFDRQIVQLDRLAAEMRHETGMVVNRAALIRAVLDGLFDSKLEITTVVSEQELRARIAQRLRH
jgi:hypothetical protein